MTNEFVVKEIKEGVASNGSPYVNIFTTSGDKIAVWDKKLFETAKALLPGQHVTILYETKGNFKNATKIDASSTFEVVPPAPANGGWDSKKDRRITRSAAINSAIEFSKLNQMISAEHAVYTPKEITEIAAEFEAWVLRGEDAK